MTPQRAFSSILLVGLGVAAAFLWLRPKPPPDPGPASDQSISTSGSADRRPDVLLILVDTLRADRLGVYGHQGDLSPTIDRLAEEGMIFERAVSQAPWTQPSVASLFTSQYPSVHGVLDYRHAYSATRGEQESLPVLSDSVVTMAEIFREAGFATAAFVANPFVTADFGFAQGFDHFDDSFASNTTPGDVVNEAFLQWVSEQNDEIPFFALLHYMDVHGPYGGTPDVVEPILDRIESASALHPLSQEEQDALGYLARLPSQVRDRDRHQRLAVYREYWFARYEAGVALLDGFLAELESDLRARGLWDSLFVILTADHGEALAEHGHWDHGTSVHNPELQVPLILRWPAGIPQGRRVGRPVQLIDLLPTLSHQLGLGVPEGIQGTSLHPAAGEQSRAGPAFAEATKGSPAQEAVYSGTWKVLIEPTTDRIELFDLTTDELEQIDVSGHHAEVVQRLLGIWVNHKTNNNRMRGEAAPEMVPVSPELRERLDALGYLD